ncbi:MAG: hypothetical protein WC432_07050 [Candidatus Omnitrophota bacterium]|jgi:hypothetical protein
MKKLFILGVFLVVAFCAVNAFASTSQTVNVSATVPTTNGLSVDIHKVIGSAWTTATAINFGTLTWDSTDNIFRPLDGASFVLDVNITENSGTSWTVTHNRSSLVSGSNNIDNNVNVSFVKATTSSESDLEKVSFYNSDGKIFTKETLSDGWLRIYYGIASGSDDASGVTPLGASTVAGTYTGSVTLTLS